MNVGQQLLEHLVSNSFLSAQNANGDPVVFIWNSNAAEQLEAWLHKNATTIYNEMIANSLSLEP